MLRVKGLALSASFCLTVLLVAQWKLLGSVYDHYFSLLIPGIIILGMTLGIAVSGFILRKFIEHSPLQIAAVWFALSAISSGLGATLIFYLTLGSVISFLVCLVVLLVPYLCAGIAINFIGKLDKPLFLIVTCFIGMSLGLLTSPFLIEHVGSVLALFWLVSAGLGISCLLWAKNRLSPVLMVAGLGLPVIAFYYIGLNSTVSPVWSESTINLAKPLYADLKQAEFLRSPLTNWSGSSRTDYLLYKEEASIGWFFNNGSIPVPVVSQQSGIHSNQWWQKRFPLMVLPIQLGKPESYLSIGAVPGVELSIAKLFGVSDLKGIGYNNSPLVKGMLASDIEESVHLVSSVRDAVDADEKQYDQIFIPVTHLVRANQSFSNLEDSYIYTREAFQIYWDKLAPGGLMVLTAVDPRLYFKLLFTVWSAVDDDLRANSWGMKVKSGTPLSVPYQYGLIIKKGQVPFGFSGKLKEMSKSMPVDLLFGPGIKPVQPFELLNRMESVEKSREVLTGFLSKRSHAWIDIEPSTDLRPFFFHLTRKINIDAKWVLGVSAAGLIYCFIFAVPGLRKPNSQLNSEYPPIPIVLGYFAMHGMLLSVILIAMLWQGLLFFGSSMQSGLYVFMPWVAGVCIAILFSVKVFPAEKKEHYIYSLPAAMLFILLFAYLVLQGEIINIQAGVIAAIFYIVMGLLMSFSIMQSYFYGLQCLAERLPDFKTWAWAVFGFAGIAGPILTLLLAKAWTWDGIWFVAGISGLVITGLNFWLWRSDRKLLITQAV